MPQFSAATMARSLNRIVASEEEISRLGDLKLIAGMPLEAVIRTGDRSMISYLIKPMADQIARAFREK
jgi:HlyD family secretion protein